MSSISFDISRGDTFASASGIFVFSFKAKEHLQEVRNVLFWTLLYLSCMIPYQSYLMFLLLFPNSAEAEFLFEFRYCIEQVQDVFTFVLEEHVDTSVTISLWSICVYVVFFVWQRQSRIFLSNLSWTFLISSIVGTTILRPPISCILDSSIPPNLFSFSMIDGIRFKRWPMINFLKPSLFNLIFIKARTLFKGWEWRFLQSEITLNAFWYSKVSMLPFLIMSPHLLT